MEKNIGGTTMTYQEKLKDPRWQKKRLEVFERDEWICQRCCSTEETLCVHHRYYRPNTEPWDYPLEAFITLCESCHEHEKETRSEYEKMLLSALKEKFLADDLYSLVNGFTKLILPHTSEVSASILEWTLSDPKIQKTLCGAFFKSLEKVD